MENLVNYITYLTEYFDILIETEEAAELMKQEVKSKTYHKDRCESLRNECIKVYTDLFLTFNKDLNRFSNELSIEILKRDTKEQGILYATLFDIINEFADKVNRRNKTKGFSIESIGTKYSRINVETPEGRLEEKDIEYNFSIAMLADDLCIKFNQLQTEVNKRFKSSRQIEQLDNKKPNIQQFPPAPKGIFKPACEEKFYEVEKSLMQTNLHLDTTGRWIGSVDCLAEFIWCLKDLNFFIKRNLKITKGEKDFFKNRYKINKQLEQKTIPSLKVDFAKNQFKIFFPQINIQ